MGTEDDGPVTPWFVDGVAWHGMFDADDRVLAWLGSVPDGANTITRDADGEPAPFVVVWLWNVDGDSKGSPGGGWEYQSAAAARKRFVAEVAKAAG